MTCRRQICGLTRRQTLFASRILAGSCCITTPSLRDRQFPPDSQRTAKTDRQPDCVHPIRHYPRKPSVLTHPLASTKDARLSEDSCPKSASRAYGVPLRSTTGWSHLAAPRRRSCLIPGLPPFRLFSVFRGDSFPTVHSRTSGERPMVLAEASFARLRSRSRPPSRYA